ncbi:MAG: SHOCT domain-containing protein [Haloarculaceae archaeon]
MGALQNLREEATGVVALLVLGLGLADIWLPWLVPGVPFWVVFVVGFAVVVPLVGVALGESGAASAETGTDPGRPDEQAREEAPLDRLKRRYAEGELTDEEFERRLERLLETEDEAAAADYLRREGRSREREEA